MNKWIDAVCRVIDGLIALMLAIMVLLVFGNVVLRYGFNSGILLSEEVSRWLFIWITFLGAVVALRERAHLGVDMLVTRLPPWGKKFCLALTYALMLFIVWLVFEGSLEQTRINWDVQAPVTGASLGIVYSAGMVFACGAALILVMDLLRLLSGRLSEQELVAVQENDEAAALAHALHVEELSRAETQAGEQEQMIIAVFLGTLILAMAIGMPISFALLLSGVALMWQLDLFDAQILAQNLIGGADSFPLLAIPFFMLAGEIMNAGGLSRRIVNLALTLVGHVRGGLGYVTIMAGCLLAALSGSAVADAAALSALLLPMMVSAGHDKARSGGLIAAAGIIAPVLPPSIGLVIFGVAANVSISKLFMAAIVPGLLIGGALWVTWAWLVRRETIEPPPRKSRREIVAAAREAVWALMLPVIILVGLRMGVFTPTEAAVAAAVYAFFVATFVYKELSFRQLYAVFVTAGKISAVVMFLIAAAMVSAWLITVAGLPAMVVALVEPFMGNKILLMIALMLLVMAVGTVMDMTPTILILTPVLMPVVIAAGIDPVYFGVMFIINNSIGLITPPVGVVLNVVAGVGKMRMEEVTRGVLPFMLAEFSVMFLMVLFPQLVMVPARWFGG